MKSASEVIRAVFRGFKKLVVEIILQKCFGTLALFVVYIFILGPTSFVMRCFFRERLEAKTLHAESFWVEAHGDKPNIERSYFQS